MGSRDAGATVADRAVLQSGKSLPEFSAGEEAALGVEIALKRSTQGRRNVPCNRVDRLFDAIETSLGARIDERHILEICEDVPGLDRPCQCVSTREAAGRWRYDLGGERVWPIAQTAVEYGDGLVS